MLHCCIAALLRPLLKQWLDDNLPGIVETAVQTEVERIARSGLPAITLLGEMFPADPVGIGMMLEPMGLAAGPVLPTREWRELYAALDCAAVAAIHPFYTASVREFDAIVYSTGFKTTFPFLDKQFLNADDNKVPMFKRIFVHSLYHFIFSI